MSENNIYTETLPEDTLQLVSLFQDQQPDFLKNFYLSGGTGLSLQIGHRQSEDLDFFIKQSFNPQRLEQSLHSIGQLSNTELFPDTLNTYMGNVKLQFLEYPYLLLEPIQTWNGIQISSILDIACTKLQTVGMRGSKKDFIDLYFLFNIYSLEDLFKATDKKYSSSDYNKAHILKSLVYFADADEQPMPKMIQEITWEQVKEKMITVVRSFEIV